MSVAACAALVERGDPDRFAAVMAAPVAARVRLFPLYAFNLEVARAPWVTQQPLIAEMRLQWWRDVVAAPASGAAKAHEVAGPLWGVMQEAALPVAVLDTLIAARRWDIGREPFAGAADFDAYIEATGAGLMWLACAALGAPPGAEPVARAAGWSAGLAGFLRAVPELTARGRQPLVDASDAGLRALAAQGLARLDRAGPVPAMARPALLAGWQTRAILRQVQRDPGRVLAGALGQSDFARKGGLLWAALRG